MVERIFVVPLRKARRGRSTNFTSKAIKYLRNFVGRHMKADEVIIEKELNEFIWGRGIQHPPRKVEVKAVKTDGKVSVNLSVLKVKREKTKKTTTKKAVKKVAAKKKTETKKAVKKPTKKKVSAKPKKAKTTAKKTKAKPTTKKKKSSKAEKKKA